MSILNSSNIFHSRFFSYALKVAVCLFVFPVGVAAQSYVQKHKGGDFYMGVGAGFSQSLAENAVKTDFITHQIPSANLMIGYNFTPTFGLRLLGGVNAQTSRCSNAAQKALPQVYGNGRYGFMNLTGSLSALINVTNIFFGYDNDRPVTWSFLMGAGYLNSFGFDKDKINKWNEYPYYPVDPNGGSYISGHAGLQCAVKVSEPLDIDVELRANATDNKYNGVSNGNHLDFYVDLMINLVYHFKNHSQHLRRFCPPKRESYVDPVLRDHSSDYVETVRFGESMHTVIPFYSGFSYLNAASLHRIGLVASFLKQNPSVNLVIVGHPDVIEDEDVEYNHMLATKRAQAVRDALVNKYRIDESRLRLSDDDTVLQPYKTVREWVPAVNFVMEEQDADMPAIDNIH